MKLMYLFGSFKPSERAVLLDAALKNPSEFQAALEVFLVRWAEASWIEEYNVERVGEWIAAKCPIEVQGVARKLAIDARSGRDDSRVWRATYDAFLKGMNTAPPFLTEVHAVPA